MRCPRCGATARDPVAGHCACCGGSLHTQSNLGMRSRPQPAPPPAAARGQSEFARGMADQPSGLPQILGMAALIALGLAFVALALGGALHVRGIDRGVVTAVCVCIGALLALYNTWRLVRFYQAPLLHRVALVAHERTRTTRTKHGWRTRHYATFEFEGGGREEFPVSSSVAAQVARGDRGVAITRDTFLLAFHRTGRA